MGVLVYVFLYLLCSILFVLCFFNIVSFMYIYCYLFCLCGPGSSVCIATDYGLYVPGSNPGGDEFFRPSRPAEKLVLL